MQPGINFSFVYYSYLSLWVYRVSSWNGKTNGKSTNSS